MTPERWQKIEDIFQAALDLSDEEREKFLRAECDGDAELRAEVDKLISRFESEDSFLESPVWTDSNFLGNTFKNKVAASLEEEISSSSSQQTFSNRKIGVYLLTKQIGKGGMGVVYAAERADGEFQQKVAVKLIKRGMDNEFIVQRFRHERQILAQLNHPNIARLLDGGTTPDGSPYFIMEFIEGAPLFKFSETNGLDLRERLKLFLAVCNAVSYAHGRKIIHRDIKPGNILVDSSGNPKLLDFGIAKILDTDLIHEAISPTVTAMRLMTPEYASPEQVRGDQLTPASDQYSLGILLYELVTGTRPYKFPSRAPHEIARVICEEIPTSPSSAENKISIEGVSLKPNDEFSRKLDRIILKMLRKDPAERYSSVNKLAQDIERLLDNKEVLAEPFTAETKVLITGEQPVEFKPQQKSIAILPLQILNVIDDTGDDGQFLSIGLADALITKLSNVRQFTVRPTSSVLRFAENAVDAFKAGRELNVEFVVSGNVLRADDRLRISIQLLKVANQSTVWAERFDQDFTDFLSLEDEISTKVAEALVPQLTTGERRDLAKRGTDSNQAHEAYLRGRFQWNKFTQDSLRQSIQYYQKAVELDPKYALAYAGIADYFIWLGIFGALSPAKSYQPAKQMAQRASAIDPNLAEAHAALGFAQLCGDYDWKESEKNIRHAIGINPNYAVAHNWLAIALYTARRFDEGIEHARKSVELDPLTYQNYRTLSWGFYFSRRFEEALVEVNHSIEKFPMTGTAIANRSWLLRSMGKSEEALRDSEKALQTANGNLFVVLGHAQSLAAAGRIEEAEKIVAETEAQAAMRYVSYYQIALVYCYAKQKEKALAALERAYEDREGWLVWLNVEPALDFLRKESRFIEIVTKVKPDSIVIIPTKAPVVNSLETGQKSVAVLPFKVLNAVSEPETGDDAFLGIGLADALITRLSNVRQFVVRPTSSVLQYSANDFDSFTAGKELNVGVVLNGNILRTGKKIRVSIQLLDIAARSTVWAERFDEDFTDVLELEDKISAKVVESLVPQLTGEERNRLEKRGTESIEAFEAYLRGRFHWNTFTDDGFRQAIYFYRKAIEIDPNYALAYAAIADYYVMLGVYNVLPVSEFYPHAKEAALRAIELDDKLSEAFTALGLTRLYGEFNWKASEENFLHAIELNANNPIAHLWYSHNLYTQRRFEEGSKHIERAIEIDPLSFQNHNTMAWSFYFQRRVNEAILKIDDVIKDFPTISHSYFGKACFLNFIGKTDEALAQMKRALDLSKDSLFAIYGLAQTYGAAGEKQKAEELIEKTKNEKGKQYFSLYQIAQVYCYLKDKDKAFEFLEQSFRERESLLVWLAIEPSLDILRDDARYKALLTKINHPLAQSVRVLESDAKAEKSEKPEAPKKLETPESVQISRDETELIKENENPANSPLIRYTLISAGIFAVIVILYFVIKSF